MRESGDAAWIECVFRRANELIAEHVAARGGSQHDAFLCECADESCTDRVSVSLEEFQAVRAQARRFVLLPGHDLPDVERVVAENDRFVTVEKATVVEPTGEANSMSGR